MSGSLGITSSLARLAGAVSATALLTSSALVGAPTVAQAQTPITMPLGQVFSAPLHIVHGLPTSDPAPATELARFPGLNFLEATPSSGGYQFAGVFQSTVTPPPGMAFTFFVSVRPSSGLPFRISRLPDGSGAAQRSTDGGLTWTTFAPATAQLSGQNVSVTVGQNAGLSPADDVSVGWEAIKPDNTGVYVESGDFNLGSLAGQGPPNTLLMPRLGTAFVNGLPSGYQTCTLPDGARPISAVLTPGTGISLHFAAPRSQGTITVGDAPDFESTATFNYLTGSTSGNTFTIYPGQYGSPSAGTIAGTGDSTDILFPSSGLSPSLFPTGPGAALVIRASAKVGATDCDSISAMVPFSVLAGQHVPAVKSAGSVTGRPASKGSPDLLIAMWIALAALGGAVVLALARRRSKQPAGPHSCERAKAEVDAAEAAAKAARARADAYYRDLGDLRLEGAILGEDAIEHSDSDQKTERDIARAARAADERLARAREALRRCLAGGPDLPEEPETPQEPDPNARPFDAPTPNADAPDEDDPDERIEIG